MTSPYPTKPHSAGRCSTSTAPSGLLEGLTFDVALEDVAREAAREVDAVDAAGAVVHRGADLELASSAPLAATIDAAQHQLEQGPCLHAFHTGRVVLLDLGVQDPRWPDFQAAAVTAGARTVLSLPLRLLDQTIGALNLYSRTDAAFGVGAVRQAELFSRPAALRLSHVGVAVHAVDAAEVAALELQDRATIDQALGVLMAVHRDGSVARARRRLEQVALDQRVGVLLAAARLLSSPPRPEA